MGALEDDIDYSLRLYREENLKSHTMVNPQAKWDDKVCSKCHKKGSTTLMMEPCKPAVRPAIHDEYPCNCGFC